MVDTLQKTHIRHLVMTLATLAVCLAVLLLQAMGVPLWGYLSGLTELRWVPLLFGITLGILVLVQEWNGIWNLKRVNAQPLNVVEATHPYLPKREQLVLTALLTALCGMLASPVAIKTYVFTADLISEELTETPDLTSTDSIPESPATDSVSSPSESSASSSSSVDSSDASSADSADSVGDSVPDTALSPASESSAFAWSSSSSVPAGSLTLEVKQETVLASDSPMFTLVNVALPVTSDILQNGELKPEIALREIVKAAIDPASDLEEGIASALVNTAREEIAQVVSGDSIGTAILATDDSDSTMSQQVQEEQVADALSQSADLTQQIVDGLVGDAAVSASVTALAHDPLVQDQLVSAIAQAVATDGSVQDAISSALTENHPELTGTAITAITQAVADDDATIQAIADATVEQRTQEPPAAIPPVLSVTLVGPNGQTYTPSYHFVPGSVVLVLDPLPRFTPGLYSLQVSVTNPLTGEVQVFTQDFAWGVLAMNADQDRYLTGDTALLSMGVLNDLGEMECDATLTLFATAPDGSSVTLTTQDGGILRNAGCTAKDSANTLPDFWTVLPLTQSGVYHLTLRAETSYGTRSTSTSLHVRNDWPVVIRRTAATRLYPAGESPMNLQVTFGQDVTGTIQDFYPEGFTIVSTDPGARLTATATGTIVSWTGSWSAGSTATFHVTYDAPDVSPQFFLTGPLRIDSSGGEYAAELRAWQIANDAVGTSTLLSGMNASDLLGQVSGLKVDPQPVYTQSGSNNTYPKRSGFRGPHGIVLDTTYHRLFVSDWWENGRVLVFLLNTDNTMTDFEADYVLGRPDFSTRSVAVSQSGLSSPDGLAFDATRNRLFVVDHYANRILVFDVSTLSNGMNASYVLGQPNFSSTTANITRNGLWRSGHMVYDAERDYLFVAEWVNKRVLVFSGASISNNMNAAYVIGQPDFTSRNASITQAGLGGPWGIAYDSARKRLFVSDLVGHRIMVYDVTTLSNTPAATMVLGQSSFATSTAATTRTGLSSPIGMTYDPVKDLVYVNEAGNCRILAYDASDLGTGTGASYVLGQSNFTTGTCGTSQTSLRDGGGMAIDSANQILYSQDYNNNRVMMYDVSTIQNGEPAINVIGQDDGATPRGPNFDSGAMDDDAYRVGLSSPQAVTVDPVRHLLFLADQANNRVVVHQLSSSNAIVDRVPDYVIGQTGFFGQVTQVTIAATTQAGLSAPRAVAVDSANGRLFVADASNNRVLVYSLSSLASGMSASVVLGQSLFTTATAATSQAGMSGPQGLYYDSTADRLYVADTGNNRILAFSGSSLSSGMSASLVLGQTAYTTATARTVAAGLRRPTGILLDSERSLLLVSDRDNNRILGYNTSTLANGTGATVVLGQSTFTSSGAATTITGLRLTTGAGVALDTEDDVLYVSDGGNNRVLAYDVSAGLTTAQSGSVVLGQPSFTSSGVSVSRSSMYGPAGLAFDVSSRQLFVSDLNNHRVLLYDFSLPASVSSSASSVSNEPVEAGGSRRGTADVVRSVAETQTIDGVVPARSPIFPSVPNQPIGSSVKPQEPLDTRARIVQRLLQQRDARRIERLSRQLGLTEIGVAAPPTRSETVRELVRQLWQRRAQRRQDRVNTAR